MTRLAGITVERTLKGIPTYVRIDLRKNPEFVPILEERGIEINKKKVSSRNPAITGIPPRGYVTLEDFREQGLQMINELCDKYGIDKKTCAE